MSSYARELWQEVRRVLLGRAGAADAILPPMAFVLARNPLGWRWAALLALLLGVAFSVFRWRRGQPLGYALSGIAGTALAVGLALIWGRAAGFFLPGLFGALVTAIVAVGSIAFGRPLVALSSHLARRWPLAWYWHPRVRPAYTEVTWFWAVFSLARAWLQARVLQDMDRLVWVSLLAGWPLTLVLLILSYMYGSWRLKRLGGPSVDEFGRHAPPPFEGQQQGF